MKWTVGVRFVAILSIAAAGCGDDDASGVDMGDAVCSVDAECDDGLFCTGSERCDPTDGDADAMGCVSGGDPCAGDMCNELNDECVDICSIDTDADGDGADNIACGGNDCDDADADRYPGNDEVCDAEGHDEDCDASTFGFRDMDMDGFPDQACCNVTEDDTVCGQDCDDMQPGSNPDNAEVCNGRDDDCDGVVDEGVQVELVEDADGDGFGSAAPDAATMMACGVSEGWQVERVDCDDDEESVHPGAGEICNAVDDDCDISVDEDAGDCACTTPGGTQPCGTADAGTGTCRAGTETCISGSWTGCDAVLPETDESACDMQDEDCDGTVDEGVGITCYPDSDDDGYAELGESSFTDCMSSNPARAASPFNGCPVGSTGTAPAGANYDCDDTNDALVRPLRCYPDGDMDSYGRDGSSDTLRCGSCNSNEAPRRGDCCDTDSGSRPNSTSWHVGTNDCGSYDWNCNGSSERRWVRRTGTCVLQAGGGCAPCSTCVGYVSSAPGCGGSGSFINGCNSFVDPDFGFLDCEDVNASSRAQQCR